MDTAQRSAIVSAFSRAVFGEGPSDEAVVMPTTHSVTPGWDGQATVHNIELTTTTPRGTHRALLAVVHPVDNADVPLFTGLNFRGNHTIATDEALEIPSGDQEPLHYDIHTEQPQARGARASRWPVVEILRRGFGIATACYLQLGPDSARLHDVGLLPLLQPDSSRWGGIGVWAWYLQRILDVLVAEGLGSRHIAFGHSRLGKTAIWAAAQDDRFDGVVSNNSGCMGASMSTSPGVETPALLASVRPYWFNRAFVDSINAGLPPVHTQDRLLATIAPRPIYVASAADDAGADPAGEQTAAALVRAAEPDAVVGQHVRPGKHDVTAADWQHYLDFFAREDVLTPAQESGAQAAS